LKITGTIKRPAGKVDPRIVQAMMRDLILRHVYGWS
jgi:hypothetical protein